MTMTGRPHSSSETARDGSPKELEFQLLKQEFEILRHQILNYFTRFPVRMASMAIADPFVRLVATRTRLSTTTSCSISICRWPVNCLPGRRSCGRKADFKPPFQSYLDEGYGNAEDVQRPTPLASSVLVPGLRSVLLLSGFPGFFTNIHHGFFD
ncbi:hypothetical protein BU16DRAFT_536158 [Lophium mytilinum]|uniref:Uncharacterized protein n=1 Tax=Lophium mytilinum TaxID=390894 RepID=A0A6A6R698_9PEZI|nr:hypothetical protein BU16DRAFT_536158 [Lophium mytilinum]